MVVQDGRSADKEVLEETVTMQVTRIANALRDTDPAIRKQVAAGACALLSKWWELLTNFGGQLIGKLMALLKYSAFDSESPKTRVAVLEGLALLVQNPLVCCSYATQHCSPARLVSQENTCAVSALCISCFKTLC